MDPKTKKSRKQIKTVIIDKEYTHPKANVDIDLTKDHIDKDTIERITGFPVHHLEIYQRAFVHVSVKTLVNKTDKRIVKPYLKESYERLEFLGDSLLGAIVAEYLFRRFPDEDEGFMTKVKIRIVNGERLAYFAEQLGMQGKILVSGQGVSVGVLTNYHTLEDAFEALLGAIFLDFETVKPGTGFTKVREFVLNVFDKYMGDEILKDTNYKDKLIRYCNNAKLTRPTFDVRATEGPPHDRTFIIDISMPSFNNEIYGTGIEKSKIRAEQAASKEVLKRLKII